VENSNLPRLNLGRFCVIVLIMRKLQFVNDEIYHIYNRGVDKRNIFLDDQDYFRFIHDLFEFNDEAPAPNSYYFYSKREDPQFSEVKPRKVNRGIRKLLVEILVFCLMPNHYHLLLKQKRNNGITRFMQKFGTGYTMYFNKKQERTGSLFQGSYKAVPVSREAHFIHLPYYIQLNPLDLIMPEWRMGKIKNYKKAAEFLESYRWSSHLDYIGKKNFPSVTQREFLLKIFGEPKNYKKEVTNWLKEMDLAEIKKLTLE